MSDETQVSPNFPPTFTGDPTKPGVESRLKDSELRATAAGFPTSRAWCGAGDRSPGVDEGVGLTHDSSALVKGTPTRKRLTTHSLPHEVFSLIEAVLTNKDEIKVLGSLRGDAAQTFIDTIDEALDLPDLPSWFRSKCLSALCRICGRQALLPKSLHVPLCYNRLELPRYRGGYADVWMGIHLDRPVAAKVLRVYSTCDLDKVTRRFCKEVVTWKSLRHPNVLPLLGVTMDNKQFVMVSEWMINGNINEFVKAHRDVNRFELLKDVARGLIYIHGQAMVHGDLKGANILIDQSGHARLADFGLLTIVSDPTNPITASSSTKGGTTRWMSPELLAPDQFGFKDSRPTKESDCYALGMVILEVLGDRVPFAPLSEFTVICKVVEGEHPERPEGVEGTWFTDDLWQTLNLCWATRPESRPTIGAVLEFLERVSRAWKPPSPRVDEDVEMDEDDGDLPWDPSRKPSWLNHFHFVASLRGILHWFCL